MTEKQRAYQAVAELSIVGSHGKTRDYQPTPRSSDNAPLLPSSGYQKDDDREPGFALRSHAHFVIRLKGCKSERDYSQVADDAKAAVSAWQHADTPPKDSTAWREAVGKASGTVREVAAEWNISPSYAHQLRRLYADAA